MHKRRYTWLILALLLLSLLCTACDGAQNPPGDTPTRTVIPNTQYPTIPTITRTPTVEPSATPTLPLSPLEPRARRSDFLSTVTPPPTATPKPAACAYDAQFVADVTIPDGAELAPGDAFVKTWQVRNSGDCDWGAGFELVFAGGEALGGPSSVSVSPTLAGESAVLSVSLTAPQAYGDYLGRWELRTPQGEAFGDAILVQIAVPSPATPTPVPLLQNQSAVGGGARGERLVLLNYFAWYDANGWDDCNISAGDKPLQPYGSDDPAAIARHVNMALQAGADGLTLQWFAPGERTDRNFETLLAQSQGTGLRSTVVFLRHIWHGAPASQADVVQALRYLLDRYSGHPNFLTYAGKPVLFITDVYRAPLAAGQTPQQAWASIRAQVDPQNQVWWIAEGLDPSYLAVFDGLWVYKITHAAYPQAYLRASQWASAVRQWEAQTGQTKLWIATLSPGWDDLRSGCKSDIRAPSQAHRQERWRATPIGCGSAVLTSGWRGPTSNPACCTVIFICR
jgi:hypothetical protein